MSKKNLIRSFVIATLMSMTLCSAAYATTVSKSVKVIRNYIAIFLLQKMIIILVHIVILVI